MELGPDEGPGLRGRSGKGRRGQEGVVRGKRGRRHLRSVAEQKLKGIMENVTGPRGAVIQIGLGEHTQSFPCREREKHENNSFANKIKLG